MASQTHAIIIGEQCPYCTKFRSPMDMIPMPGGAKICAQCERNHQAALDAFSTGNFTGRCSECDKHWTEMKNATGRLGVFFENGKYRVMCLPCSKTYVPKRKEFYKGTEFAHQHKLD